MYSSKDVWGCEKVFYCDVCGHRILGADSLIQHVQVGYLVQTFLFNMNRQDTWSKLSYSTCTGRILAVDLSYLTCTGRILGADFLIQHVQVGYLEQPILFSMYRQDTLSRLPYSTCTGRILGADYLIQHVQVEYFEQTHLFNLCRQDTRRRPSHSTCTGRIRGADYLIQHDYSGTHKYVEQEDTSVVLKTLF